MRYINVICLPLYLKVLSISYMPKPNYTWNTNGKAEHQKYASFPFLLVHKGGSPNHGDLRDIKCCSTAQASENQTRKYFSGSKNGMRSKYLVCHQPCQAYQVSVPPKNMPLAGGDTQRGINFSYYPVPPSSPFTC